MPFDAFSKFLISLQHRIFYVVLALARFNLYRNSYVFLVQSAFDKKRARGGRWTWWLEVAGIAFFWCWFGSVLYGCGSWKKAFMYLLVSHIAASPVHVQVYPSCYHDCQHYLMATAFRLSSLISPCPPLTLVLWNRSHTGSYGQPQTSYAHPR